MTGLLAKKSRFAVLLLLAVALFLGIFLRTASFRNFINPDGGFYFYNIDSYEHLRRVDLGVHTFPRVPAFDSYAAYPVGLGQIWSPLFDYLLSAVCVVLGGSKATIETVCFFANPFYTALTVVIIFFLARRAFSSDAAGLAAAFVLSLNPPHISISLPMNLGHHVFEAIAILLLFGLPVLEKEERLRWTGMLGASFLLVLAIFMWRGSTIYWGIVFLTVLVRCAASGNRKLALDYSAAFAAAALMIALYCVVDPWRSAAGFRFGIISWFHVLMLGLASGALASYAVIRGKKMFLSVLTGVAAAALLALAIPAVRHFLSEIATGITFLRGGGDAWLDANSEMKGTFSFFSFLYSASFLTAAWFAIPLAAILAFLDWRKDRKNIFALTLALWSPVMLFGLVLRYSFIAGTFSALAAGYLFSLAWKRWGKVPQRTLLTAGLIGLVFLPSLPHYESTLTSRLPDHMQYGLYGPSGVLEWIRNNTPRTSYYYSADRRPEYGILESWDLGAQIYYGAQRPAVATAFGWEAHGFYEWAGFMATGDQDAALTILQKNNVRYVLTNAFSGVRSMYTAAVQGEERGALPAGTVGAWGPGTGMYERLMYHDGSGHALADSFVPALGNYRLLFETAYRETTAARGTVNYYKVFEVVPGAIITGKAKPFSIVLLRLPLATSANREFLFQDAAAAGQDGRYRFRVPYATTKQLQGATLVRDNYQVYGAGIPNRKVSITEQDVREGRTISVP
jgi:asparagine N-glycosylation enzyme membrane subunit Stt3